jgi:hypothetical protein
MEEEQVLSESEKSERPLMVLSDNGVALPYRLFFKILESVKECKYAFSILVIGIVYRVIVSKKNTVSWKESYLRIGI